MSITEENNIEIENSDENAYDGENIITNPFSTKDIAINNRIVVLPSLVTKLTHEEIDLNPEFQRNEDLCGCYGSGSRADLRDCPAARTAEDRRENSGKRGNS